MSLAQPDGEPDVAHGHLGPPVAVHLKAGLAAMHPAYFALAMATGIVAIACDLLGLGELAVALARINLVVVPAR